MTFPSSRRFRPVVDRRRILLVESDADLGALFVNVLTTNGARVVHVAAIGAVLEAFTTTRPDVVIIDLDGLAQPFAVISRMLDAPLIVLAGAAGGLAVRARESGFRWVLDKPVPVERLLTAIATVAPEKL